mgnify:CR=1 FL=1
MNEKYSTFFHYFDEGGARKTISTHATCVWLILAWKKYFEWKKKISDFFSEMKNDFKQKISDRQKKNLLLLRNHIKVIQIIINVEEKQKRKRKKLI